MKSQKQEWLDVWHVNPSLNRDYDFVDGLRGLAILLVIGCHLIYVNPAAGVLPKFVGGIFSAGAYGVSVFFALSGFLISLPFWKRKNAGTATTVPTGYAWRRFWKVYPPLALTVVAFGIAGAIRSSDTQLLKTAGQWLAGLPFLMPVRGHLNPAMWSLIVEVQFYVTLPLLFLSLRRVPARRAVWILFLTLLVLPAAARWWNLGRGIQFRLQPEIEVHFPAMLDGFACGVLMAGLESQGVLARSWSRFGDAGLLLLALLLPLTSALNLHPLLPLVLQNELLGWLVKLSSGLLLFYVANPGHSRAQLLSQPWLRWCGMISYEWYLIHQPLIVWSRESLGPAQGSIAKYLLILGAPLGLGLLLAALVYRYFSLPILRFGRERKSTRTPQPK